MRLFSKSINNNTKKENNIFLSKSKKKYNNFKKILVQSKHIFKEKYGKVQKYDKMLIMKGVKFKSPDSFIENIYINLSKILKKKKGFSKSNKIIPLKNGKYNSKSLQIIDIILKKLWDFPGCWWSCKIDLEKLQADIISELI